MLYSFTLFMAQAGPYGSRPYDMNSFISYEFYGVAYRCFGSAVFWLVSLFLVPVACAALQLSIKIVHLEWFPDVNDIGRELDKGYKDGTTPTSGDAYVAGFSLAGLFDCKRAEAQVQHGVEIIASMAWRPTFLFPRRSRTRTWRRRSLVWIPRGGSACRTRTRPRRQFATIETQRRSSPSTRRRRMVVLLRS